MKKAKIAFLHDPKDLRIEEVELSDPAPNQALVKLKACGICGSDVECYEGKSAEGRYDIAPYTPGHFDNSVDNFQRPHRWSEGEGHAAIEIAATPEGVVGFPTKASAQKAKRPVAAILKYLTLVVDQIFEAFPAGTVPPVEKVTLRKVSEMEPYLREPLSDGWESVYSLPKIGF